MGLPVSRFDDALASLGPDGVLLNTDRFEPLLAWRCDGWAGVRLAAVCRDDAVLRVGVERIRAARACVERGGLVYAVCDGDTLAYGPAINASRTILVDQLVETVKEAPLPSLVFVASQAPRDAVLGLLRGWTDRGVGVLFGLVSALDDGAVDQIDDGPGESVEAESLAATAGDCVRKPVSLRV